MIKYDPNDAPLLDDLETEGTQDIRDYVERELQALQRVVSGVNATLEYLNLVSPQLSLAIIGASDVFYPWTNNRGNVIQREFTSQRLRVVPVASATSFADAINPPPPDGTGNDFGGLSAVDYVIQRVRPQVCIVSLGINDIFVENKDAATVQADANAVFAKLQGAGITTIYGNLIVHDQVNFPGTTDITKQHGVLPFLGGTSQNPNAEAGLATSDVLDLDTALPAAIQSNLDEYRQVEALISALGTVEHTINIDAFKISRMGFIATDRFHPDLYGAVMMASATIKFFLYDTSIRAQYPGLEAGIRAPGYIDIEDVWASAMEPSGDRWIMNATNWYQALNENEFPHFVTSYGGSNIGEAAARMASWANHQRASFLFPGTVNVANNTLLTGSITGLFPNVTVESKFWRQAGVEPATWTPELDDTGAEGTFSFTALISQADRDDWYLKFKVGPDVIGRVPITIV